MRESTLTEITGNDQWIGLGIAGNQAGHLNQAGEAEDFKHVTAEENAPKGMFPWYVPKHPGFLGVNPVTHTKLQHNGEDCLQPEPEVALIVEFLYSKNSTSLLDGMIVKGFTACNDCSRRLKANKLSQKKNWGENSQGLAEKIILLDDFESPDGSISNYRVTSFLKRNNNLYAYGKDTAVVDYTYFGSTLVEWMTSQINTQKDEGPLEELNIIMNSEKPKYGVIAIGATAYDSFGNSGERFLLPQDEIFVVVYDSGLHNAEFIKTSLENDSLNHNTEGLISLQQKVQPSLATIC